MDCLSVRHIKSTRKEKQCHGCGRLFPVGSSFTEQNLIGYDGFYVWRSCPTCDMIADKLEFEEYSDIEFECITSDDIFEFMMEKYGSWEKADEVCKQEMELENNEYTPT